MASSTALKDLSKAINAFIVDPILPLPDSLITVIEIYIDKHEKYDDAVADKLQEELISIFEKHVVSNPAATGPWMGILRRLQWGVQSPEKVLYWFDACQRILDNTPLEKEVVGETIKAMMNTIAVAEKYQASHENDPGANPIIDRLLAIWTDKFYPAMIEGNKAVENNERMLREALELFGKKRTKEFFASLDKRFVQKKYRKAVLRFMCGFIQGQPPHLYQISETSLFSNLLICLQRDTSTTVVSAALTNLIMLMPHMPSSLVPRLPTLFNIYARLLFWESERTGSIELASPDSHQEHEWQICTFDPATEDVEIGHLEPYYTILYGLYPINFMEYIRKPQRYLRHANTDDNDVEVQPTEIRLQSERFRRNHILHPNFYTLTIESEKTDFSRWIKCEAAEVVADCIALCTSQSGGGQAVEPMIGSPHDVNASEAYLEQVVPDASLLNSSVTKVHNWRHAQFSTADSVTSDRPGSGALVRRGSHSSQPSTKDHGDNRPKTGTDSPAVSAQLAQSSSHQQLQDLIKSNKALKSGLHQSLANESVASLALSNQESLADKPSTSTSMLPPPVPQTAGSVPPVGDLQTQLAYLQRRVLLLENDLSFERYLKQQHIVHIGDMRSRHVAEAAMEAETQNLIMMNRGLKSRYEEAKKAEMQVKKEADKSRTMAKKWEADLSNKLKNLREESKKTTLDLENIRRELDMYKLECDKLRKLLGEAEVKELTWKQDAQSIEIQSEEVERLRAEIKRLTEADRDYQAQERGRQATASAAKNTESELVELNMKLESQQNEVQRTKKLLQLQIRALQEHLSELQEERVLPGTQDNIDVENALAASRAKQAELQKQYDLLLRKYKVIQSSLLDMQSMPTEPPKPRAYDVERIASQTSPLGARGRLQRMNSLDAPQGTTTPPLDAQSFSTISRNTTNSQSGDTVEAGSSTRAPDQRIFSGLANRIRKDSSADKTKDDTGSNTSKPKKEKKSSALRGIRGFVSS